MRKRFLRGLELRKLAICSFKRLLMFVPRVILVFAKCCLDEALRSATGAVCSFLYRWTISMVATKFDINSSQTHSHFMRKRSTLCCIVRPAVPCSLLRLLPIYARRLSKFKVHAMDSRQANGHHQVQPSVHACSFLPVYWNHDRRLLNVFS
ncbi:hypothetical protein P692DRAFT_2016278 [Suillus brevipes Sb2]|nr:hypothetical protein P692DRAFT_2016278 [Suillus brevipes Sb2]